MVALSKTGEVADFIDIMQFQFRAGRPLSQFMCGFTACMVCRAMAQVGKAPTMTPAEAFAQADSFYRQYDGSDDVSNTDGMSLAQLYELLHQIGLHYQATAMDINVIKHWIADGYPVIVAVTEVSVYDLELKSNPYTSWRPAGTHIIVITGVTADGNVLVRDTANCTDLYNPNSLRPGPRKYDSAKLQLVSATVCVPPWMARPASATPPAPVQIPVGFSNDDIKLWNLLKGALYTEQLSIGTGIAQAWRAAREKGCEFGPPLGPEWASTIEQDVSFQCFAGALAKWNHATHTCTWYDARGAITIS